MEQIKKKPGKVPIQQQMETHAKKLTKTMGAKSGGAKHGRNGKNVNDCEGQWLCQRGLVVDRLGMSVIRSRRIISFGIVWILFGVCGWLQ